ncbi:SgrR family transcriptional regulator [Vibrio sinaloensis]|uniref:SgrR family transcriptional regulator n=1 Tax=Photobacterium sp. (strain ATCC 43367) TaxID=379097 RepID=UPI0035E623C6
MSDLTLLRYYSRLAPLGVGDDIKTALPMVAETLFTSARHARNLLNDMQDLGWLTWTPKVGRNQRSTLLLNHPLMELKKQLAAIRVQQGKYEKALEILDNDQVAFGQLLQTTSGASMREGRLHIQLTYKRPFARLVPHDLQRSSERYLLRQIYCCLVHSNGDGVLEPQLAHHWHYDESTSEWTFYLRPGLSFHNGDVIDAKGIADLFNKLKQLPHYQSELSHLSEVTAPLSNKVVFKLSIADQGFGGLISGVKYGIQPANQLTESDSKRVVGSGPFSIYEHSNHKLCLEAFERYYGCRALTDQVTIWQIDETELREKQIETNQPEAQKDSCNYYLSHAVDAHSRNDTQQSRIEDGCLFVLFNQQPASALSDAQRRYLSSFIKAEKIIEQLIQSNQLFGCELAYNLLPIWHKIIRPAAPNVALPTHITIAVYDYTALQNCALALKALLEQQGTQVTINVYSFRDLNQRAMAGTLDESLILTNINLDDNRHASAFSSLYHNPVLQSCIGPEAKLWLTQSLNQLRSETPLSQYLSALEPIASALINQYWLTPLFHHRQTLRFHGVLKDVALTNWGWPDIKNVWSAD